MPARSSLAHVEQVHPHPHNVREDLGDLTELTTSIAAHGVLQPLVVRPNPDGAGYQILTGHRRIAAARKAGQQWVPIVVRAETDDVAALEVMLVENCQRRDLNPMEKAEALQALRNRGHTQGRIAKRTGMSGGYVSYLLSLLELDENAQEKVRAGDLSADEAVTAVRKTRHKRRKKAGSAADWTWEPDHLCGTHPQAKKAERLCRARGHTMRRVIGKTACGQCWETAIRLDERTVIEAEERETAA